MSEENKKANITEDLNRALKALESADILFKHGNYSDAVSRLYYFLFHVMKALLLSRGLEPKSHEGTLRLFGMHFVKEGIFLPSDSHIFSRLLKYREEADYNTSYVFTNEDFIEFKKDCEALYSKILNYLKSEKYI
jgi:uncharacterized protein (UPF0332 family)